MCLHGSIYENVLHALLYPFFPICKINNALKNRQRDVLQERLPGDGDDHFLYALVSASATFGLIGAWINMDIEKTPAELVSILRRVVGENLLL